jgi:hypothetical protein
MSDIVERLNRAGDLAIPGEPCAIFYEAADEIESLRLAIRRLAEQDATMSVCGGAVTVTLDATLTDAEREAVENAADVIDAKTCGNAATLRGLLARLA